MAANDHFIVLAFNEEERFHFSLTSHHEASADTTFLEYTSFGIKSVRRLSVAAKPSTCDLIELVFIGELRNSSERTLFHVKLRWNETDESWSIVHLINTSITSLSGPGVEPVLALNPLGTLAVVLGDRAGYLYMIRQSRVGTIGLHGSKVTALSIPKPLVLARITIYWVVERKEEEQVSSPRVLEHMSPAKTVVEHSGTLKI